MNQGAYEANEERRQYAERLYREQVTKLLMEIRDLLKWRFRDDPEPSPPSASGSGNL